MTLYKLPKRYHPDFKLPKIKPKGNVELDLSDIGRHVTFGTLLLQRNLADLKTGNQPASIVEYLQSVEGGNQGYDADTGASTQITYDTEALIDLNTPFTIYVKSKRTALTVNSILATIKSTATSSLVLFQHSTGYDDIMWGGNGSPFSSYRMDSSATVTDVTEYIIAYNGNGDDVSNFRGWINDIEQTVVVSAAVSPSTNLTVIGNRDNGNLPYNGWIESLFVFNKDLSGAINKLANNIYLNTLKPKVPLTYSTIEASGGVTGTITQNTQSFTQSLSGNVVNQFSGTIEQTASSFTQSASGSFTNADFTGVINQTLSSFTQSATGDFTGIISGTINQTSSSFTQSLSGVVINDITGTITVTISSFTQSASGAIPIPVVISDGLVGSGSLGLGANGFGALGGGVNGSGRI